MDTLDAIACENGGDISNCYVSSDNNYIINRYADALAYEEMQNTSFVSKLDCQTHSVLSAWLEDKNNINDGLPITLADYNYTIGKYKVQPEMWIPSEAKNIMVALEDGEYSCMMECYYNEAEPIITVDDINIAKVTYANEKLHIELKKAGMTKINIHFDETENNVSADYQLNLEVSCDTAGDNTDSSSFNGWCIIEGKHYWYENGVRQGVEGRGKEIYDPDSDAWYWLDAVQDGAKAVSKDVYQESYSAYPDRADGTGKWVRYDENGHMVKGWQTTDTGIYYFESVTGAMAKGEVSIDGQEYHFDEVTGILLANGSDQKYADGWNIINGIEYWYENGIRQGYNPDDSDYRGKEIYDPNSDAWYWLDNIQNGAKAVSKDVYQESYSAYPDRADGTGKWVRYDENGHMVKGWQATEAGIYYFETVTGAMAKGDVAIDGINYCFDENTGILIR